MSNKQMPPVPPANRSPKGPANDSHPTDDRKMSERQMKDTKESAGQANIQQNTRNQGNPTSRGGNPHAK